jgi:hypothetical protein
MLVNLSGKLRQVYKDFLSARLQFQSVKKYALKIEILNSGFQTAADVLRK